MSINSKNPLKILRNKTSSAIAMLIVLTFTLALIAFPAVNAHTPAWEIPTYAYINAAPNPAGIGQKVLVVTWINTISPTAIGLSGDQWKGFKLEVTDPSGTKTTVGTKDADPAASTYFEFTPTQVGEYTFDFSWPGQQITGLPLPINAPGAVFVNDTYKASSATTKLIVQEEQIAYIPNTPLPGSYWMRPIYGENTAWNVLGSHWLGGDHEYVKWNRYGAAPDSSHIAWAKPLQFGGIVGGSEAINPAMAFYDGTAYEFKFAGTLILYGNAYYSVPRSNDGTGGGVAAVNLRTGEQLWYNPNVNAFSFGQLYDFESPNQHGTIPNGYLWEVAGSTWRAYDPMTGLNLFNVTNVPGGTQVWGPQGEILRYALGGAGAPTTPRTYFTLWNNTQSNKTTTVTSQTLWAGTDPLGIQEWRPVGKTVNMGTTDSYSMNVTLSTALPPGSAIRTVRYGDFMFGYSNSSLEQQGATGFVTGLIGTPNPYTLWAVNLNSTGDTVGRVMWTKSYTPPAGNITIKLGYADYVSRVFTIYYKETMQWEGYSLDTGDKLWGPTPSEAAFNYYGGTTALTWPYGMAYGRLYSAGFSGVVYAYNLTNGNVEFTYGNGGEGNSTNSGLETAYGSYPIQVVGIADGKVFLSTSEHSYNEPKYKGAKMRAIDAMTGKEVWKVSAISPWQNVRVADGYVVFLNLYDQRIYSIGPGPSATTVTASPKVTTQGNSIIIEGTVTDQSPGAKDTPAIADEDMGEWMEYIYMGKPAPANAKGVTVALTAFDPNGNTQDLGTVTSDFNGVFRKVWVPPVPGEYQVFATFVGSGSYGSSYAETFFNVDSAPETPQPPETPPDMTGTYVTYAAIAVIVAIAIVGAIIILVVRKRP